MSTFVVSDIHGNYAMLWSLLNQEGLVDDEEKRTELGWETTIVSVGDLLNGVFKDVHGDEMCAHIAPRWFDLLLVGNHEWPYLFRSAVFNGYYDHPPLRSLYNSWKLNGFVRPALLLGETLVTHAGWARWPYKDEDINQPTTAADAYQRIVFAWERYPDTHEPEILDGIGRNRGGWHPVGGILWSDWQEGKIQDFNQVVGHTPNPYKHPELREYANGNWSLCIDSGCKGGGVPSGVWLDDAGQIEKIVSLEVSRNDEGAVTAPSA